MINFINFKQQAYILLQAETSSNLVKFPNGIVKYVGDSVERARLRANGVRVTYLHLYRLNLNDCVDAGEKCIIKTESGSIHQLVTKLDGDMYLLKNFQVVSNVAEVFAIHSSTNTLFRPLESDEVPNVIKAFNGLVNAATETSGIKDIYNPKFNTEKYVFRDAAGNLYTTAEAKEYELKLVEVLEVNKLKLSNKSEFQSELYVLVMEENWTELRAKLDQIDFPKPKEVPLITNPTDQFVAWSFDKIKKELKIAKDKVLETKSPQAFRCPDDIKQQIIHYHKHSNKKIGTIATELEHLSVASMYYLLKPQAV